MLGVVYLLFNEGYSATEGDDWMRPQLCDEAVRLGRILTALVPDDAEVHGLSALMELQSSRLAARAGADGEPILLDDQDRRRWDASRIRRGLDALARADALVGRVGLGRRSRGPYVLQAAIAAEHARAASVDDTDWRRVADLYEQLGAPHRVARGRGESRRRARPGATGPRQGSRCSTSSPDVASLRGYHLVPACAATCTFGSAGTMRPRSSSNAPPA